MPEPRSTPERIDLSGVDDPRDAIHVAVAWLAQGGVAWLPTESGPTLAVSALRPEAVARASTIARTRTDYPVRATILLREPEEVIDWAPSIGPAGLRPTRRAWPGSLVVLLPADEPGGLFLRLPEKVRREVESARMFAVQAPAPGLLDEVSYLSAGPILTYGLPPDDMAEPDGVDLLIVCPSPTRVDPTVIRIEREDWTLVRRGDRTDSEVQALSATLWLFICTGNTCRSPMAEAICKERLAARLGCKVAELVTHGHAVGSAGVAASNGMAAAGHAVETIRARDGGASLQRHQSRRASPALLRGADLILALSGEHLDAILELVPDMAAKARMLLSDGRDIDDPIGSDRTVYSETARQIEEAIDRLLDSVLALKPT